MGTTNDRSGDVARHETASLISSDKVEGTTVYDPSGDKLGTIHSVMISKREGQVSYAVLSFGGFLGMGTEYFPVPWSELDYDPVLEGYVVSLTEAQLKGAPHYSTRATDEWSMRESEWPVAVDKYYRGPAFPSA